MKTSRFRLATKLLFGFQAALILFSCRSVEVAVEDFRIDFISNLGKEPIFSWATSGAGQEAYQIFVSSKADLSDKDGDHLWDSGKQRAHFSMQVSYEGPELQPGKKYYARVKTWPEAGGSAILGEIKSFLVPLEYPADWEADWLTYDYQEEDPLPLFRRAFELEDPSEIAYAVYYISAPGYYEAYLNGEKLGAQVLDPGQTNYEDYTYYTAFEIDPSRLQGENVLGVMLGHGWYNQYQVWKGQSEYAPMVYGQPVFICQLVIHKTNGDKETIGSGESWEWTPGPITYSNVYGGESYDARKEVSAWNRPGLQEGEWYAAENPEIHPVRLFEQFAEPIHVMEEIEAIDIIDRGDGRYIFDFGQNLAGWMKLSIRGEEGQTITVQCTEVLDEKGRLDPRTTGQRATGVIQTQQYTCKGEGLEQWTPRFCYFGFRYAQVEGLREAPSKDLLRAQVVHTALEETGTFASSEDNLTKLHELSRWTIRGNIHSIPTDCPHREKCGWTGDAHALILPMIYNWDAQRFFQKYIFDMRSSAREEKVELYFGKSFHDRSMVTKPAGIPTMIVPGKRTSGVASPDWGTAMVQIPWYLYVYYGDRVMLEDFYPDMKVWVDYVAGIKEDGIIPHGLGDWCPPGGNSNKDCPVPVSSSAFHILDVSIMEQAAGVLGKAQEQASYANLLTELKADFNRHFFDPGSGSYGSSQTANILALDMGMVPEGMEPRVCLAIIKNIREEYDGFLNTGIFGLARVFKVLSEHGYEDEVYRLLSKTGENSFACMWDRFDATTLWEQLPTREEFGSTYAGSMNHPMQAGFNAWFYSGLAGINPSVEAPGFLKIVFKPYLTEYIKSVSASYESKSGPIVSEWSNEKDGFKWKLSVPANSTAEIYVPVRDPDASIRVNGSRAKAVKSEKGYKLEGSYGAGEYRIHISN